MDLVLTGFYLIVKGYGNCKCERFNLFLDLFNFLYYFIQSLGYFTEIGAATMPQIAFKILLVLNV